MKTSIQGQVIGVRISSIAYPLDQRSPKALLTDTTTRYANDGRYVEDRSSALKRMRLGAKITETLKGKLRLGARILQVVGIEKMFKQLFSLTEGEKLLKASQCYLSTTAGPLAGLLFISSEKISFCSQKAIKFYSPNGELVRVRYKVVIPVNKIKKVNQSVNMEKPSQKYIEIVTVDDFDFWFMGFLNYKKAFKYLQQAVSQA
ncbi:hypothetical protein TIFTF001_021739 [Ficus carica]|uniref:GRAM domain-containing protein n=1 Tax=Ficus carica TaxID=3494 RepID=A0AA88AKX7_FICCA|nr:hypothetical protein TIFTF001_021739 [Ficus carica]